ncbi:dihydrofolate reductase [Marinicella sp. S1101]|uniref:dihydrofolate reductase n=1 Tax=Marinicella marina TaxID=2996016 RepID=UPI00226096B8|nr:dihydrofolate reductase [Marinicella marina]MCX7554633.1 dihydrofolate reductase [Marinicella marina]MDJ1140698.1 dihydrofolate reductase [Marinicella marina]
MKVTLIAAMDTNQLIGANNDLPWRLSADLQFFKRQTTDKTILMGRKTCESLPFALPNRKNLVLTRNPSFERKGFETINDLDLLKQQELDEVMIIGGAKIYELLMPHATHMIITHINATFDGDTYFPDIDWNQWHKTRVTNNPVSSENPDFSFDFVFYERVDVS